jgi:hypothetical protein
MGNASNTKAQLYAIDITFTLLSALAVALRLVARSKRAGIYGWDDWLCVVSLVVTIVNFAMNTISELPACDLGASY